MAPGMMGELEEAEAALKKGLENAFETDDVFGAGFISIGYCIVALAAGDAD